MKPYEALFLLTLLTCCTMYTQNNDTQNQRQEPTTVALSKETIATRNALVAEITGICEEFFNSKNRETADVFRRDERAVYQQINGTPEEVEALFALMYHTHADAKSEQIALHYALETLEAQLRETGLSQAEVYLISIDAMDTVSANRCDPELLQQIQETIKKQDPALWEQERQYALALLYKLEHQEYESEGERIILAIQARNMLERTYIRKKYAAH